MTHRWGGAAHKNASIKYELLEGFFYDLAKQGKWNKQQGSLVAPLFVTYSEVNGQLEGKLDHHLHDAPGNR